MLVDLLERGDEVSFVIRDAIGGTVVNPDCLGISVKPCHFILMGMISFHCNDCSQAFQMTGMFLDP
jgi:hypothetical protein